VHARVGDVILHPGDVLLLDAGPDFHREAGHSGSGFALVSVLEDSAPPRLRLLVPVLAIAVAMIAVYSAGVTELLVAAIFAAAIMIACGALSEQEARDAIKWDVIVTIAAAFGMSKALQNSGVAGIIAERLVSLAKVSGTGRVGLLTAVYFATFLISNVVTNNAAAALMFPIAAEAAEKAGETLQSVSFLVMLAASASFMSPFGYQTNLMVYGPGGYVFADFLRFGSPMQVVQMVVSVTVVLLGGLWWTAWVGGFGMILLIYGGRSVAAALEAALCGGDASKEKDEGEEDYGDGALKSVPESEASAGPLAGVV
jgi:di/tricarboxylate transporter